MKPLPQIQDDIKYCDGLLQSLDIDDPKIYEGIRAYRTTCIQLLEECQAFHKKTEEDIAYAYNDDETALAEALRFNLHFYNYEGVESINKTNTDMGRLACHQLIMEAKKQAEIKLLYVMRDAITNWDERVKNAELLATVIIPAYDTINIPICDTERIINQVNKNKL